MLTEAIMTQFIEAWDYLNNLELIHYKGMSQFEECLSVDATRVNPKTLAIDDNIKLNTKVQIRLEFGRITFDKENNRVQAVHDPKLDAAGDTFEEAIIELSEICKRKGYKEHKIAPITDKEILELGELHKNQKKH